MNPASLKPSNPSRLASPPEAKMVAPVPSPLTTASSAFIPATPSGGGEEPALRLHLTSPESVNAVSAGVNHSTTGPAAVSVHWIGAVHPTAVLTTSLFTPSPRAVQSFRSTVPWSAMFEATSVRKSCELVGSVVWKVSVSVKVTNESPEAAAVGPSYQKVNVKPLAIVPTSFPATRTRIRSPFWKAVEVGTAVQFCAPSVVTGSSVPFSELTTVEMTAPVSSTRSTTH